LYPTFPKEILNQFFNTTSEFRSLDNVLRVLTHRVITLDQSDCSMIISDEAGWEGCIANVKMELIRRQRIEMLQAANLA
jgi:hypothetical protein